MSSRVKSLASDQVGGELHAPRWHSGFLDAIVGRSRDVVIVSDPSLTVVFAAGAIRELTGWDASDIVGTDGLHLIHPDDLESFASHLGVLFERPGQRSVTEARILRRDGGWVWVEVLALNLLDDPSVNGLVGQFRDITDRKRAEEALRASAERFGALVQHATDVAVIVGLDGAVTWVSPAAERILGWSSSDIVGHSPLEALHPDDVDRVEGVMSEAFGDDRPAAERAPRSFQCRSRRVDGGWSVLEVTASSLVDVPAVAGIVLNVRDVTDAVQAEHELRASEQHFAALVRNSSDIIAVIEDDGRMAYISPSVERLLGYPAGEVTEANALALVHPDDLEKLATFFAKLRRVPGSSDMFEIRFRHHSGDWRWMQLMVMNLLADQAVKGLVLNARDVTERKRAEEEVAARAAQQAAISRLGQAALATSGLQGVFEDAVKLVADTLDLEIATAVEMLPSDVEHVVVRAGVVWGAPLTGEVRHVFHKSTQSGFTVAAGGTVVVPDFAGESRFEPSPDLLKLGVVSSISAAIPGRHGAFGVLLAYTCKPRVFTPDDVHFVESIANVIGSAVQRDAYEQRLTHQATHDLLTGMPNRVLLLDRLHHALSRRRDGHTVAVLFLDLDRFKLVNDAYSHEIGDQLLAAAAERLAGQVRIGDTVARFGGDEFVVLCEDLECEQDAADLAERILAALSASFDLGGSRLSVSASMGIAFASDHHDAATLLSEADAAMYQAKEKGKNRWEPFDLSLRHRLLARVQLEADLRLALANDEFRLVYQPIVELATGRTIGMEALLRWQHPELGLVMPSDFIHIAEETGSILSIGAWVIGEACAQAARWRDQGTAPVLEVAVNLSARQFDDPSLVAMLAAALDAHRLSPEMICLEITESVLMTDASRTQQTLQRLKALGVCIAIDDFGTGYSSLAYLKRFPVDRLKIDRSFVEGLGNDAEDTAIVAAIIRLAESLDIDVVAEGIETDTQLSTVRELRCAQGQGYYWSEPQPPSELA